MHTDARTLDDGSVIEGDLCIVGAGAAGISMAMEWIGTDKDVVLLEGGGFDVDADVQSLYRGDIVGERYFPLEAARLHFFGGTTNHWAGFCSILDPIDFEERDWVPHSGWPISYDDMMAYYPRAHEILQLGPFEWDPAYWAAQHEDNALLPFDGDIVRTKIWQFSPPTRFGRTYRDEIVDAPNIHLYTHANVTRIEANEPVSAVTGLRIRTLEGKELRVRADAYVLACGAIQNARLLLASNERAPEGLGNDHDLVGRYFMEHLEMPGARLALTEPRRMRLYEFHYPEYKYPAAELTLSESAQRENSVLNGVCSFRDAPERDEPLQGMFDQIPPDAVERLRDVEGMDEAAQEAANEGSDGASLDYPLEYQLFSRQEQAPNPNSRVTIGSERDALGVPRVQLDWQLTEL
ncbi:MAG: FAD-dependent oxidoreductase, partial [Rhodothermales bacterium]